MICIVSIITVIYPHSSADKTAYAADETEKKLEEEIDKALTELSTDELEKYFDALDTDLKTSLGGSLKALLKGILDGNINLSSAQVIEYLINSATKQFATTAASLTGIAILAIFYGMSGQLTSGFKKESTKQLVYWAVYGGIVVTVAITISNLIIEIKSVLNLIADIIEAGSPIFATIITAIGGSSAIGFIEPAVTLLCGIEVKTIVSFILPLFYAVTVFTIVGNMSDNIKLDKLSKALKSIGSWTLGIMFSLITTLLSVQGLVGASIDTVSIKSAKFALSSYVPILGGYLSEGFDIVCAGAVLIKNAVGLALFLVMLGTMLVPIIKTVLYSLSLKLLAGFLEPITDKKVTDLLYVTGQNLLLPVSACAGVGFTVFVLLSIIIGAFNAGVV